MSPPSPPTHPRARCYLEIYEGGSLDQGHWDSCCEEQHPHHHVPVRCSLRHRHRCNGFRPRMRRQGLWGETHSHQHTLTPVPATVLLFSGSCSSSEMWEGLPGHMGIGLEFQREGVGFGGQEVPSDLLDIQSISFYKHLSPSLPKNHTALGSVWMPSVILNLSESRLPT